MRDRSRLRSWFCIVLTPFLLLGIVTWLGTKSIWAAEKGFSADRHQARGAECSACHKESPPKAAVPAAVCLGCHGSYAKVAMKTDTITPNPHASHMGALPCESCHHGHKPSEDHCASCHEFGLKVP